MTVEISGGMGDTETDEPFPVNIILGNRSVFPVMNVDIDIHMENCLFGISGDHRLSVPSYVRAANVVSYEISESFVGVLTVSVKRIYVTDWLGFIRIKKTSDAVKEIEVFPGGEIEVEPDMTTLAGGMSEAEETSTREMISQRSLIFGNISPEISSRTYTGSSRQDVMS